MLHYPEAVDQLIDELRTLPGVGRRAAERMALALLERDDASLMTLGGIISAIPEKVWRCPECGVMTDKGETCEICSSPRRDRTLLCVVENMSQLLAVESSCQYNGTYLVLGGHISPIDDELGTKLNLEGLKSKASSGTVKEIILALSSDVEGRATAAFLAEMLAEYPDIRVSRPALGLPAGANLSYANAATIGAALRGRIVENS
ncbi:MAG: recombination protein RecR [Lentisphaeria bacterium]|nr:recombination protein RecR [Lentisphaeria bacterium]